MSDKPGSAPEGGWQFFEMSEAVTWTVERKPQGCWKCRLRALIRWPRPYRHFGCGPERGFPGVPTLADLISSSEEEGHVTADLPDNCATLLECRKCMEQEFRVSWNWKPVGFGTPSDGAWMLECTACEAFCLLERDGLPNPQEIHGAKVALPIPAAPEGRDG